MLDDVLKALSTNALAEWKSLPTMTESCGSRVGEVFQRKILDFVEKGRILQGLVYSLASFLHVESHARVDLESFESFKQGGIRRPPCIECFCKPDFDHFSQHCLS